MIVQLLILLTLAVASKCSADNFGILLEISDKSSCNNDNLFRHFKFSAVPQFGAMCNIPVPNENEVDILLQNNVVPILCMGVYDVSVRLCNEAISDTAYFKDIFPPSTSRFDEIFKTLKQSNEYFALDKFCSTTITKHKKSNSSSNITRFWWEVLSNNLAKNESCFEICRSNDINRVHPLCSYIIWVNDLIINHHKSLAESEASNLMVPVEKIINKDLVQQNPEESAPSGYENKPPLTNEFNSTNPGAVTSAIQRPIQAESSNVEVKGANQSTSSIKLEPVEINEQKETAKSAQNTSSNDITNINTTYVNLSVTEEKPAKENESKKKENDKNVKLSPSENKEPAENLKADVGNKDQVLAVDIGDDVDQNNFNGEINLDIVPSDQTVSIDPETQHQFDEELEDVEDDGNMGGSPEKTDSKKGDNSIKHDVPNDRGKPDEAYSEVERTVLLEDPFIETEDSHFFTYFLFMSILTIMAYLAFHNKNKLLALAVEGRRNKSSRRRPNSSNYSKLDCSLEEAMVSNTTASVTHVLY